MELISPAEVAQFRDMGFFLTDVVFTPDELTAMAVTYRVFKGPILTHARQLGSSFRL